jgi:hypothetical protein
MGIRADFRRFGGGARLAFHLIAISRVLYKAAMARGAPGVGAKPRRFMGALENFSLLV